MKTAAEVLGDLVPSYFPERGSGRGLSACWHEFFRFCINRALVAKDFARAMEIGRLQVQLADHATDDEFWAFFLKPENSPDAISFSEWKRAGSPI
jgi:hypothetical protein